MKTFLLILSLVCLTVFISCGGDSEEDMRVDCSASDLEISVVSKTVADCLNESALVVEATGGTSPYEFNVGGGPSQTLESFSLSGGTYNVSVTDGTDCQATIQVVIDSEPNTVSIDNVDMTSSNCLNASGTLSVSASGGDGTLMYQLDGGGLQSGSTFNNVSSGDHTVTVVDSEGCESSRDEYVSSNTSLNDDIMPIISANCAVSSSCHGSGATGPRPELESNSQVIARSSRILARAVVEGSMPPAERDPLSQNERDLIACWIDDGALDN